MGRGRDKRRRNKKRDKKKSQDANTQGISPAAEFVESRKEAMSKLGYPTAGSVVRGSAITSRGGSTSTTTKTEPKKVEFEARPNPQNVLRFSPLAWSKFRWFRDRGDTEIGGFALSHKEEPLYIVDFLTILQECTATGVEFDDEAQAKFMEHMVSERGHHPSEFMRIWLHTHPGSSASPSGTDIDTFRNIFGTCDWSIMVILARGGELTAKLRFNNGPGTEVKLDTQVDLHPPYEGVGDEVVKVWDEEYTKNIQKRSYTTYQSRSPSQGGRTFSGQGSHYDHRGYYGGAMYGDYDDAWWDAHNNDTNGFKGSGSGGTTSGGTSGSSAETLRARLVDQTEIPPYGGVYRLQSREKDQPWQLVNSCVENVWQVDKNDDETTTVVTDLGWYTFGPKAKVNADPGDDIDSIHDISDEPPMSCGEVSWRVTDNDDLEPMKITRILPDGNLIDLRLDDKQAESELPMLAGASSSTGSTSDSAAGFAPSSSTETEVKPEDKAGAKTAGERQQLLTMWKRCAICGEEIDIKETYYIAKEGDDRAHEKCVPDDSKWTLLKSRPQPKTDIMTKDEVAAATAANTQTAKENDESGFGPASNTDS